MQDERKLVVAMFAWDGNSYIGNEYWEGMLAASGDPAAASCSFIPELLNPDINQKISGYNLHVASLHSGVQPYQEYQDSTRFPDNSGQPPVAPEFQEPGGDLVAVRVVKLLLDQSRREFRLGYYGTDPRGPFVEKVYPRGSAARNGLKKGDQLIQVGDVRLWAVGREHAEVGSILRGAGDCMHLVVSRPNYNRRNRRWSNSSVQVPSWVLDHPGLQIDISGNNGRKV